MEKIRKGDQVVVLSGKDKGRRGAVLQVLDGSLLVESINRVKRHTKGNPQAGKAGGIIEKEMPLHISNVMLLNPATGKGDRVGFKFLEAQAGNAPRKVRFFKSNGEVVDV